MKSARTEQSPTATLSVPESFQSRGRMWGTPLPTPQGRRTRGSFDSPPKALLHHPYPLQTTRVATLDPEAGIRWDAYTTKRVQGREALVVKRGVGGAGGLEGIGIERALWAMQRDEDRNCKGALARLLLFPVPISTCSRPLVPCPGFGDGIPIAPKQLTSLSPQ